MCIFLFQDIQVKIQNQQPKMDDLHNSKVAMVSNDQVDHADDVTRLDTTYQDLLKATSSRCSVFEEAVEVRKEYTKNVTEIEECLEECGNEIPSLQEAGMMTEEKLEKCQVLFLDLRCISGILNKMSFVGFFPLFFCLFRCIPLLDFYDLISEEFLTLV